MTFRERLKLEHPEMVNERYIGGCKGCPERYGYEDEYNMSHCSFENCKECWDREIPESEALNSSEFPNNSDTISRQAAIDAAKRVLGDHEISRTMQTALHILPSAQPERKTGHWIEYDKRFPWSHHYKCSECGNYLDFSGVNAGRGSANYCPNCGAKMKGVRHEGD